ncbi:MAG: hypothetical protein ACM34K_06510 [Bacillota bacterium]
MAERPVNDIYCSYIYAELEYVRKRIQELTDRNFKGVPEISRNLELESLFKKEAYYILQLANLKGVFKQFIN